VKGSSRPSNYRADEENTRTVSGNGADSRGAAGKVRAAAPTIRNAARRVSGFVPARDRSPGESIGAIADQNPRVR
jgi:hypothetical protein